MKDSRTVLGVVGLCFLVVALQAFFEPLILLGNLELHITGISGFAEIRACYSGTFFTLAYVCRVGVVDENLRPFVLKIVSMVLGVFSVARFVSLGWDGQPNDFSILIHVAETLGFFACFRAWWFENVEDVDEAIAE
ncbi:MAG: DUF4345 family protein [Myxococcota bacterium]|nr:DUF4345 family protein [Myxococcota bacterium]